MHRVFRVFALGAMIPAVVALGLSGCHKEGPAEKAGEKIDNTLGTNDAKSDGPFEKTGESIDKATDKDNQ